MDIYEAVTMCQTLLCTVKVFFKGLKELKSTEVNLSKVPQTVMAVLSFRHLGLPGSKGQGGFSIGKLLELKEFRKHTRYSSWH